MNDVIIGVTAGRDGRASTSELLVEKSRLEAAWIEKIEGTLEPYSLDLGIRCGELRKVVKKLFFTIYGVENAEELEFNLWMLLHHKIIRRFRDEIKRTSQESKRVSSQQHNSTKAYIASFHSFICTSMGFYASLLSDIVEVYKYAPTQRAFKDILFLSSPHNRDVSELSGDAKVRAEDLLFAPNMCYKIFIRLGDLARYGEIYTSTCKNWKHPISLYKTALCINPYNGNAYNQLGLIDAYSGYQLGAITYAIKALVVDAPFRTSENNIMTTLLKIHNESMQPVFHSDKEVNKSSYSLRKNFDNSYLGLIATSLFSQSMDATNFTKKTNSVLREFSIIVTQHIDSSEEYMFNILIIPIGILNVHFSHLPASRNCINLGVQSVNRLVQIIMEVITILFKAFTQAIPNSEHQVHLLKMVNLGLHWIRSNETLLSSSLRSALASVKGDFIDLYSELSSIEFKDIDCTDGVLDEYIDYGMFTPFNTMAYSVKSQNCEGPRMSSTVANIVRIKMVAECLRYILESFVLQYSSNRSISSPAEQKKITSKSFLHPHMDNTSILGMNILKSESFNPGDIMSDIGITPNRPGSLYSSSPKMMGFMDSTHCVPHIHRNDRKPISSVIQQVFESLPSSYSTRIADSTLQQDLSYSYYNYDVQKLTDSETRSLEVFYPDEHEAIGSDMSSHISCDPVNTISFLGLENNPASHENINSKHHSPLSPTND